MRQSSSQDRQVGLCMRGGWIWVFSALFVFASFAAGAAPKSQPKSQKAQVECPGGLDAEGKEELLRKAPTCDAAMALFEACAYGASGDTGLGAAVIENCEASFAA